MKSFPRVLGVDLSLTGTGLYKLGMPAPVPQGLFKTKREGDSYTDEITRMQRILDQVASLAHDCDLVAIEGLAFMARNTTALVQLSGLNYMVRHWLVNHGIKFVIVAPSTLKKFATGKGNAKKDAVLLGIYKNFNLEFFDDNIGDAFVLAKLGSLALEDAKDLPQFQQEAVDLIRKQL